MKSIGKWIELVSIILSKEAQSQKNQCSVFCSPMWSLGSPFTHVGVGVGKGQKPRQGAIKGRRIWGEPREGTGTCMK